MPLIKNPAATVQKADVIVDDGIVVKDRTGEVIEAIKPARKASDDDKMSKADWAAKDRRISRAGLYQAALQSPALMQYAPTLEDYLALVRKAAEAGLAFVNEAGI